MFTVDVGKAARSLLDYGTFPQNIMIAARGHGIAPPAAAGLEPLPQKVIQAACGAGDNECWSAAWRWAMPIRTRWSTPSIRHAFPAEFTTWLGNSTGSTA